MDPSGIRPFHHLPTAAAGLLLSAVLTGDIDRQRRPTGAPGRQQRRNSTANCAAGVQWCANAVERRSGKYFGAATALRQISLATGETLTLKRSGKSRRTR